ncbi:MAG: 7-cyano-7-deazaguanine synthase QueC, partial [Desulfuromonadales bacterium]|nr:7-cyano-7-deazaguanine synthase QueC [Desulfuromonadales bacterium]
MERKAVVLYSGGLDSTTCMAIAREQGFSPYALSFSYGQRHAIELVKARENAARVGAREHLVIDFDYRLIGGSSLTTTQAIPKDGVVEDRIPTTYVPARNAVFLAFALGWAEVLGAFDIFIGVNALDYSGYPDCRPEFITAFETMANLATRAGVEGSAQFRIHAPLIELSKADIVKRG